MVAVPVAWRGALWRGPWLVLLVLLGLLLIAAVSCERTVEDMTDVEISTYLQAESLAYDLDLEYGDADRDRSRERFGDRERDLVLAVDSDSGTQRFGHPQIYPLVLAPFVRVAGQRGPAIANALLLGLAAFAAVRQLGKRLGNVTPLLIALLVFASVTYRSVFLVQPHILLLSIVVVAIGLTFRFEEPGLHDMQELYRQPPRAFPISLNWFAIGLLTGITMTYHPVYGVLLLPVTLSVPADYRKSGIAALAVGVALPLFLALPSLEGLIPSELDMSLSAWNLLYLAIGRNVGVIPYFLPLILALGMAQGGEGRTSLWLSALVGSIAFALLMPFNFFDGPAAVGNGWLLPLTGALWFVPTRPLPRQWIWITAVCAAPLMMPTWIAPTVDLVTPERMYRHASGWLNQWLPPETSQRPIPNGGEVMGQGLWVRSLSGAARPTSNGRWLVEGNQRAQLLLASPTPLGSVYLQFGSQAEPELELRGGSLGNTVLAPDGSIGFQVEGLKRRAQHPMWWSSENQQIYLLSFEMPQEDPMAQTLTIRAFGLGFGGNE